MQIAPDNYDADQTAAIVEQAIKNATRERDSLARHRLREAQTAAQERLARLLSSSPAVIYSFKATGDFAPTFVSDNIIGVFGYAPAEYLEDPSFWRDRVHPDDLARVESEIAGFFQNGVHTVEYRFRRKDGSYCWVNDEQHLIRGADGKPLEIVGSWSDISKRKAAEEAKAAAHSRLSRIARLFARSDLQLQGDRGLRADLRQREHHGSPGIPASRVSPERRFLATTGAPRGPCCRRG